LLLIPALFSLALDARHWFMQLIFGREQLMPVEEKAIVQPAAVSHVVESLRDSQERVRSAAGRATPQK
jgi:hypothetical protein